jgi:hypothetical protein
MKASRLAILLFSGLIWGGGVAIAQTPPFNRTFVSARSGLDTNSCLPTAPCRTFSRALIQTAEGGEIIVLDSGGFGAFLTINQSVSIVAPPGVYAGMSVLDGDGITINTLGAVHLRGITLNGSGATARHGVLISAAAEVNLEDMNISSFNESGIEVNDDALVTIRNSVARECGTGIRVQTQGGAAQVTADHVILERNSGAGMFVVGPSKALARDCVAVHNTNGFAANGSGAVLVIDRAVIAHPYVFDRAGVIAYSGSTLKISNSVISNVYNGFQNYGNMATVISRGNNTMTDVLNAHVGTVTTELLELPGDTP